MFSFLLAITALPCFGQSSAELTDDPLKLLPPYGELPPTFWEQHETNVLIAAFVFAVLVGFAIWRLLRPKPPVLIPPEVQARQALTPLLHRAEDGALLSNISQILRRYIIAAFDLPPGEPTTTEFCRTIETDEKIGHGLSTSFADFLRECDKRKFSTQNLTEPMGAANRAQELITLAEARIIESREDATRHTHSTIS